MRLFIAIDLPDPHKNEIQALTTGLEGTRPIKKETLHLTLQFIGEVAVEVFERTKIVLANVKCEAFPLQLSGVGCFGAKKSARVLWVGLKENPMLIDLQKKIDTLLTENKIAAPETHPYTPHLTLSRLKNVSVTQIQPFLDRHKTFTLEPFEVKEFYLYSSRLTPKGAVHRKERTYPLLCRGK